MATSWHVTLQSGLDQCQQKKKIRPVHLRGWGSIGRERRTVNVDFKLSGIHWLLGRNSRPHTTRGSKKKRTSYV